MKLRYFLERAGIQAVDALLRALTWEQAQFVGDRLGDAARLLGRRRWTMTLENLAAAFPEKSPAERGAIGRQAWRNAGRIAAEFVKSRHLSRQELDAVVGFENLELVDRMLAERKGVLVNIGHMGNWEVGGVAFTAHGYPLGVIGRVMKNPWLDAFIRETRSRFGEEVFGHRNPFFSTVKWLKAGKMTAILIDHNLYEGGVFIPFFGRPAATSTLTGLLAAKLDCPIISVNTRREGARIIVRFEGPLRPDPKAKPEAEAERLTVELMRVMEGYVRARPGEWLWGHNRWKRRPGPGDAVLGAS